jgi:pyruvate/2-oxoglutarate dehydrogenase complex dihydrolipoamide acyltransferase (E2) component
VWPLLMLPCALAAFNRRRTRLLIDNEIALSERHFDLTSAASSSLCSRLTWNLTYYTFGCGAIGDEAGAHGYCCSVQHCCVCIECPTAAGTGDDDLESAHTRLGCTVCAASGARASAAQHCADPQCCTTFPTDCAAAFARFLERCTAARVQRDCKEACVACVPVKTRAEREAEEAAEAARNNARRKAEEVAAAARAAQRDKQRKADREKRDAAKSGGKSAAASPKSAQSPQSSSSSASPSSKRSSITSASSSGSSGSRNKR